MIQVILVLFHLQQCSCEMAFVVSSEKKLFPLQPKYEEFKLDSTELKDIIVKTRDLAKKYEYLDITHLPTSIKYYQIPSFKDLSTYRNKVFTVITAKPDKLFTTCK